MEYDRTLREYSRKIISVLVRLLVKIGLLEQSLPPCVQYRSKVQRNAIQRGMHRMLDTLERVCVVESYSMDEQ